MTDPLPRGILLTRRIVEAIGPVIDQEPGDLVIDALAAAFFAAVVVAGVGEMDRRSLIQRYTERLSNAAGL